MAIKRHQLTPDFDPRGDDERLWDYAFGPFPHDSKQMTSDESRKSELGCAWVDPAPYCKWPMPSTKQIAIKYHPRADKPKTDKPVRQSKWLVDRLAWIAEGLKETRDGKEAVSGW